MANLFETIMFSEAPEDEPAAEPETQDTGPPDIGGDDPGPIDDGLGDDPPDIPEDDAFGADDGSLDDGTGEEDGGEQPLEVSDKISLAMNYRLYQRFLTLLNTVSNQLSTIKTHGDIINSISPSSLSIVEPLGKLAENIRLYLTGNFRDNNYSRNLLFYNKCLNLLKLLNDIFSHELNKGEK